ncbi:MAG: hypothetical protein Q4E06_10245 [Lautropia sp.]|nr:hypothetical protein [Lautropia sp.]
MFAFEKPQTAPRENGVRSLMWRCEGMAMDEAESGSGAEKPREAQPVGFLKGQVQVPDDFDVMGQDEIQAMFGLG